MYFGQIPCKVITGKKKGGWENKEQNPVSGRQWKWTRRHGQKTDKKTLTILKCAKRHRENVTTYQRTTWVNILFYFMSKYFKSRKWGDRI